MECNDHNSNIPRSPNETKRCGSVSLLEGDELLVNRILSRDSSMGFSSRIYCRPAEGVPFKWETQPGTPRNPAMNDSIPPLSPPPAIMSSGMLKPCIEVSKDSATWSSRIWFWKRSKTNQRNKTTHTGVKENTSDSSGFEFFSSDGETVPSPRNSGSSSRSSSFNSCPSPSVIFPVTKNQKMEGDLASKSGSESIGSPLSCTPWNFTAVLACVIKRV